MEINVRECGGEMGDRLGFVAEHVHKKNRVMAIGQVALLVSC